MFLSFLFFVDFWRISLPVIPAPLTVSPEGHSLVASGNQENQSNIAASSPTQRQSANYNYQGPPHSSLPFIPPSPATA